MHDEEEDRGSLNPWHFDRRIPISIIVLVLVQLGGTIWNAARIADRIEEHDRRLTIVEKFDGDIDHEMRDVSERMARLEEKTTMQLDALNRIEVLLRGKR